MRRAAARVVVDFGDEAVARAVAAALAPEDAGYVTSRLEGATLVAEAEAAGAGALLATLDDHLACLAAAEKAARAGRA